MNRTLPPRDRGHRGADAIGAPGCGRAVYGLGRLADRDASDRGGDWNASARTRNAACHLSKRHVGEEGYSLRMDLGGELVAAVDSARPELVPDRAHARILAAFEAAHPVSEVVRSEFASFSDSACDSDRFVVALVIFGDQHRQTEVRVRLERNREPIFSGPVSGAASLGFGCGCHRSCSRTPINRSVVRKGQANSAKHPTKKPLAAKPAACCGGKWGYLQQLENINRPA